MQNDAQIMKKVIALARLGGKKVRSNPLVGAILLDRQGNLLGQGYHEIYGGNHAEINAINDAKSRGFSLKNAVLYVNLEPCCHFGKTPPCADAIIAEKIGKVIVGMRDISRLVQGRGVEILKNAGIEVITGCLEEKCWDLNGVFLVNQAHDRPYINVKIAMTIDGKMADFTGKSNWISSEKSRKYVHNIIRSDADAILSSAKTIICDNPWLNIRIKTQVISPTLVILDKKLELLQRPELNIFKDKNRKIIFICEEVPGKIYDGMEFISSNIINGKIDLHSALRRLYLEYKICKISTECGGGVVSYLLENDLFDELNIFTAPILSCAGGKGAFLFDKNLEISCWNRLKLNEIKNFNGDILARYTNHLNIV